MSWRFWLRLQNCESIQYWCVARSFWNLSFWSYVKHHDQEDQFIIPHRFSKNLITCQSERIKRMKHAGWLNYWLGSWVSTELKNKSSLFGVHSCYNLQTEFIPRLAFAQLLSQLCHVPIKYQSYHSVHVVHTCKNDTKIIKLKNERILNENHVGACNVQKYT